MSNVNSKEQVLADLIVETRKKRLMSQRELADKLSVSQSSVAALEQGRRRLTVSLLSDVAKALGKSPSFFINALNSDEEDKPDSSVTKTPPAQNAELFMLKARVEALEQLISAQEEIIDSLQDRMSEIDSVVYEQFAQLRQQIEDPN